MARSKSLKQKINRLLEMPNEISGEDPKTTIIGFNELLIENYKGILDYEDVFVRINTHIGIINISGFNLKLNQLTGDDISVTGKIEKIELERDVEEEE